MTPKTTPAYKHVDPDHLGCDNNCGVARERALMDLFGDHPVSDHDFHTECTFATCDYLRIEWVLDKVEGILENADGNGATLPDIVDADFEPFDLTTGRDYGRDCEGCGRVFHNEIGYHEPNPEGWDGYQYWCRPCAAQMGVEVDC